MVSQPPVSSPRTAELLLKFSCSACDQILNVGIERSKEITTNCPRCETPIQVPTLDRTVSGVEQVLRANPETLKHECPRCRKTSKIPIRADLNRRWTCPSCGVGFSFQIVVSDATPSPPKRPRKSAPPKSHSRNPPKRPKPKQRPPAPPPPPKAPEPASPEFEPEEFVEASAPHNGVQYHSVPRRQSSAAFDFLSNLPPRTTAWVIWAILQFPGFIVLSQLAFVTQNPLLTILALAWIIPRFGICSFLTYFIMSQFMRTFQCPHCHEEYEAVGRWGCSCGYVDHKLRHFYRFKCPMCKSLSGHISCKRCDATMILR